MNCLTKTENNPNVAPAESRYVAPPVDIRETKDEYLLEADLPGVTREGLEVLLEGNELTIGGRRGAEPASGGVVHREIPTLSFRRTFLLDPTVDTSRINAHLEQGVLTIRLPKAEAIKPRRIAVAG